MCSVLRVKRGSPYDCCTYRYIFTSTLSMGDTIKWFHTDISKICNHLDNLDSLKQKICYSSDMLLLSNRTASSGLRENGFPCNFIQKVILYNSIFT